MDQIKGQLGRTGDGATDHVAETARILAKGMGLSPVETELIHIAGHLHDIGKIGIPDAVLKKQGALDTSDWQWMRQHPEIGAEIVRPVPSFNTPGGVADIILGHHEFHNGSGYPHGLAGEAISLGARIVAVADTLSALVRDRPYRRGCSFEAARAEISRCSGTQFDPAVVEILEINRLEVRDMLITTNPAETACDTRGTSGLMFPELSPALDDDLRLISGDSAPVAVPGL
jgi:HD-GYP domain-containing protein (c-di-GMP phosphodiesterase class II)